MHVQAEQNFKLLLAAVYICKEEKFNLAVEKETAKLPNLILHQSFWLYCIHNIYARWSQSCCPHYACNYVHSTLVIKALPLFV